MASIRDRRPTAGWSSSTGFRASLSRFDVFLISFSRSLSRLFMIFLLFMVF